MSLYSVKTSVSVRVSKLERLITTSNTWLVRFFMSNKDVYHPHGLLWWCVKEGEVLKSPSPGSSDWSADAPGPAPRAGVHSGSQSGLLVRLPGELQVLCWLHWHGERLGPGKMPLDDFHGTQGWRVLLFLTVVLTHQYPRIICYNRGLGALLKTSDPPGWIGLKCLPLSQTVRWYGHSGSRLTPSLCTHLVFTGPSLLLTEKFQSVHIKLFLSHVKFQYRISTK